MRIQLVCLEISSWRGSIGAEHYYGKLLCEDSEDEIEVERTLDDQKEVDYLNKKDGAGDGFHRWDVGNTTKRFSTAKAVEERAILIWRRHFPKHAALVIGIYGSAGPRRPLDAKPTVLKKLQSFWKRAEAAGGYEKNYNAMDKVQKEYWAWLCGKKKRHVKIGKIEPQKGP